MFTFLVLALLYSLACGSPPSCAVLDTTRDSGGRCFLLDGKPSLRCCNVDGLVNGSAVGDKSFPTCEVQKAFDGRGELLSKEEVVLDGIKELLLCFSVQYAEVEIWLSCHHGNQVECVSLKSYSGENAKHLAKRSSEEASYKVLDNSPSGGKLETAGGSILVTLVVTIATLGLLVLLVMLCAGGGSSKKHTFVSTNDNDVETGTITENKQDSSVTVQRPEVHMIQGEGGDAEVQEVQLQLAENSGELPSLEVRGNSPPNEGQAEPQGGGGGDDRGPGRAEADPVVVVEDGGRDQDEEDDPRYEAVRHPQQQVQLPAEPVGLVDRPESPEGEAGDGAPQGNGVRISYAVVSRHPGQPSYASVGDVLPTDEVPAVEVDPPEGVERYEEVAPEEEQPKDGYAEVRIGSLGAEATGGGTETSSQRDSMYDTVGYDSVNHPTATSASQDSGKDDMYETVPDSVRQLSPTRAKDVAPELPPMRVRGISSSEEEPRVQSLEGSGKEGKKEAKGGKDSKPAKEKGKPFGIFHRTRASTVNPTSKTTKGKESSKEKEVSEGPPLPPNHPPAGIPRTTSSSVAPNHPPASVPRSSSSSVPRSSTSSIPPNLPPPPPPEEEEDCYSEPFDRGPATGPPRKMSNSVRPYTETSGKSSRGQLNPLHSPRGGAPNFPLPDIPSGADFDPEYESVSPETQRAAVNRAKAMTDQKGEEEEEEEGEIPYDTVARIPGTSLPISVSALGDVAKQPQPDEEEEESPYDVVARLPGSSVVVSIGASVVAKGTEDEEEEETPYDTVTKIPGTSVAVSVGVMESATRGQVQDGVKEKDDHPYSKVDKSRVHEYATVDKSKKRTGEDGSARHMTLPTTAALEHDDMGYAVVSEEFKRARTMSRDAEAMRALVKKKTPQKTETSDYSVVADDLRKIVLTSAVDGDEGVAATPDLPSTPSPPPPISPIKDHDIILDFSAPETPPHPPMESEEGSKSSEPLSRQLMLSAGDTSSPEAEQAGLLTDPDNPYETVDEDLKGYRESPQL